MRLVLAMLFGLTLLSSPAIAATNSQELKVTALDFEVFPGGFVRVHVDQPIVATANCGGATYAYLLESHPGFDTLVAALLTAHSTGDNVILMVQDFCWTQPWNNAERFQIHAVKLR